MAMKCETCNQINKKIYIYSIIVCNSCLNMLGMLFRIIACNRVINHKYTELSVDDAYAIDKVLRE